MDQGEKGLIGISALFPADRLFFLQKYPQVTFQEYSQISSMFEDLAQDRINGILIDYLPALFFIRDRYMDQIAIATILKPEEGIAMLTLKKSHHQSELIDIINRGLKEMRSSGKYQQLLKKWQLTPPLLTNLDEETPLLNSENDQNLPSS